MLFITVYTPPFFGTMREECGANAQLRVLRFRLFYENPFLCFTVCIFTVLTNYTHPPLLYNNAGPLLHVADPRCKLTSVVEHCLKDLEPFVVCVLTRAINSPKGNKVA